MHEAAEGERYTIARVHVHIAIALTFAFFADPEGNTVGLSKSVVNKYIERWLRRGPSHKVTCDPSQRPYREASVHSARSLQPRLQPTVPILVGQNRRAACGISLHLIQRGGRELRRQQTLASGPCRKTKAECVRL